VQVFDGVVTTVERVRTRKRVPESLLNLLQQRDPITHIAVLHTTALERAQEFVDEIQPYLPTNDAPIIAEVGPGIGSHVGPNGLGFACIVA
jgi:fatty acid-binding protein DegV